MFDELKVTGEVCGYLFNPGEKMPVIVESVEPLVFNHNTIGTPLKTRLRDCLIGTASTITFMAGNFFTTNTSGATENTNDGILLINDAVDTSFTMITTAHPTDASGNYYKKWRGIYTALQTFTFESLTFGLNLTNGAPGTFASNYATCTITSTEVVVGAIFVFDWKISIT